MITKEFIKEYFISVLTESKDKTAVLTYGRMSPPHIGHAKLVDHVLRQKGHHHIVVSHTTDNKKNPLTADEKVGYLKKMYPEHAHKFHAATKESPTIFHHAANLHKAGYSHLHVVVGADRVQEFHDNLHKYNGKFDAKGNGYHFKSIKVTSAGDRDPDAEGTEGMSASKMRAHALAGNAEEFKKGLHPNLHPHAAEMMAKIKDRIK
jgi:hypothetical protein